MTTTPQDEVRQLAEQLIEAWENSYSQSFNQSICDKKQHEALIRCITTFVQQQREAATLAERERCARTCETFAEGIASQNELPAQVENWADYHKGQHDQCQMLATEIRRLKSLESEREK